MKLTLSIANQIIEAAFAEGATRRLKPLTAVILDVGGNLKSLQKQDGASLLRTEIALGKAWGALGIGDHSRSLQKMAEERPLFVTSLMNASNGRLIPVAGGVLIGNTNGELLGAIGITGDTSDNYELCAMAGIAAVHLIPYN